MTTDFFWGASSIASLVIALIFFRNWRTTGDRLFALFAVAFVLFAANWIALAVIDPPRESQHYVYLLRLAAFLLIAFAVIDKNRSPEDGRAP